MKILKIFGIVVGIHVFALILIFANPGCSSTTKPPPQPADTVARAEPAPTITVPTSAPAPTGDVGAALTPAPVGFNPDAPATYAGNSGPGVRFTPTRPNTAAASAVQAAPVENVTPATTYVVKPGDSLWTLQKKFHINYKDIAAANNLKTGATLHEGQKLIIPRQSSSAASKTSSSTTAAASAPASSPSPTRTESAAPTKSSGEVTYTVRPGDTIESIAKRFEVKWKDLALHNNISDPQRLRAGTVLSIPGWKSTGSGRSGAGSSGASSDTAKSAPKQASEPKPAPTPVIETEPQPPAPASNVPVIRIDDSPVAPAPTPKQ